MWSWWFLNAGLPYLGFVTEWLWSISLVVLFVTAYCIGKTFSLREYDDPSEKWYAIGTVLIITLAGPLMSAIIVAVLPAIAMLSVLFALAALVFFGAQNNFWIKRGK